MPSLPIPGSLRPRVPRRCASKATLARIGPHRAFERNGWV